jgi:hypothetical protein
MRARRESTGFGSRKSDILRKMLIFTIQAADGREL